MTLIEFNRVSKTFTRRTGQILLRNLLLHPFSRRKKQEPFYALRDVSFRLREGESLAVVGTNGAGKSTLLGLVAGLAVPDSGEVKVNGRIAALLELGAGFHPDLTGAENVKVNASLLGLSRRRTRELFDEIVEFSEIGDFIHEPLRTYSSGMIVRLAFSIAVNSEPEILLIDEVLAVGDQAFQMKCFERVRWLQNQGKTLLFVSHSSLLIRSVCQRAIWLDHGRLMMDGTVDSVLSAYEGSGASFAKPLEAGKSQ